MSIIIRCYNEREHIGKLLHGIYQQSMEDFEVILVDSGSTDGTLEIAREFPIDDIVYIAPSEFSFGRALNYGCDAANGEFCVFASAHVYPLRSDWLIKLLEKFEDSDNLALVYGKQRGNEVTKFAEKQVFRRWFPEDDIDRQPSPFCNNANAAIRRGLWEDYKYNESLPGLEDLDWATRVQADGYDISYASEAEIIHVHNETIRQVYNRYRREGIAHSQIIEDQRFTFLDFIQAFLKNTLSDYWTAAHESVLLDELLKIPKFRLAQFWGTYRGFQYDDELSDRLRRRFFYPDTDRYPQTKDDRSDKHIDYSKVISEEPTTSDGGSEN
ncbi:glycosyltransferase family 2 protein [Halorubrum sp. SD626R]|uniref:glycosyltransferase n=1 Tax=Halorubrum sp. SD626R TaxID=1419722 RepID=UPI0018EE6672|nr:glycosyltransferase family 2 protein [Halorubrum sp. SD626R]